MSNTAYSDTPWSKKRYYKHFDHPVNNKFIKKIMNPDFVASHSFAPLIHYVKKIKRYQKEKHETNIKQRPIMYTSHKDASILSYYSYQLNEKLNDFYATSGLSESVIAYRSLGKGNYHFAKEAHTFALANQPLTILAFDVSGFFDNLDHGLLKQKLKFVLGVESLPMDWYKIYSAVTQYHFVKQDDLLEIPEFAKRLGNKKASIIATIAEVKNTNVEIYSNEKRKGIPQGTPISATLSNAYMVEFDQKAKEFCDSIGAFYRRYSDDILIICKLEYSENAKEKIGNLIASEKLNLNESKTEESIFDSTNPSTSEGKVAQYLGFTLHPSGASIRPASMSRQWRKMRRAVYRARKDAEEAIEKGTANKVFTKRIRKRFSSLPLRNFSSYARRSAKTFGNNKQILRQTRRIERVFEQEVNKLKNELNE